MLAFWLNLGTADVPPPLFDWKQLMARFSVTSNVGHLFCMLVLKDGQVFNFSTDTAEPLPANNLPTLAHLREMTPYKASGPLVNYKRATFSQSVDLLKDSDLVVMSGNADGTGLEVLDVWPYNCVEYPWIGRGGWSK